MTPLILTALLIAAPPADMHVPKNMPDGCIFAIERNVVICPPDVFDRDAQQAAPADPGMHCEKSALGETCTPLGSSPDAPKPDAKPSDDDKEQEI